MELGFSSQPSSMWPDYFKSIVLHFFIPLVFVGVAFLLEKYLLSPEIKPVPEFLEISLLETPAEKKQPVPVTKPQPKEPPVKPKPVKPKPLPKPVEEPEPVSPPEPEPQEQPIVDKNLEPVEKKQPTPVRSPVPAVTPKKAPKKTPPPLPSLDQQLENLLDDEQETIDQLKQTSKKQSESKRDQDENTAAARRSDEQTIVGHYTALIRDRVNQAWSRPPSARSGMEAILRVKLLPGGEVRDVELIQSSGDQAFDHSALRAIREAKILPVPEDIELFNRYFRVIRFPFRPEDLQ